MDEKQRRRTGLAPFVPRLTTELAELGPGHHHQLVDGSMLSADISGFTALSERLADHGREGAEELTGLINTCFDALMDAAYGYGGEVLKFGGDALLIMFRGDDHARRAGRAAQSMQFVLAASRAAQRADLTMTVGVAQGPFDVLLVGTTARDLVVTGQRATEVIRLESTAGTGETLASIEIADAMAANTHDGGVVIWDLPVDPAPRPALNAALEQFLPRSIPEQLAAFEGGGGEHRLVVVDFVMITGVDAMIEQHGGPETARQLGELVDLVNDAADRYGVTVLHSDIAPDGLKLVLCGGAPLSINTPCDAVLNTALQIAGTDSQLSVRQGVQIGRVFAGIVGASYRRTYTVMGDPVNTAARMLGAADDRDVVAMREVVLETRSVFFTEELEPFTVKGKVAPVHANRVIAATDEVRQRSDWIPFVGREAEVEAIHTAVGSGGAVLDFVGPGGSGKSRLAEVASEQIDFGGYVRFQAVCSPYGGSTPYALMRNLFRSGLGVDIHLDDVSTGELLTKVVEQFAPGLQGRLPLLAMAVGANVASTPEFEALAPEHRRDRMHEAMTEFLGTAFDRPLALIVEDVHWIDDASADLLRHAAAHLHEKGWIIVTTRRPTGATLLGDGVTEPLEGVDVQTIDVGPMSEATVRQIVLGHASTALNDRQLRAVIEKAHGNPLFAIELGKAVAMGGADQLPDSVEQLIGARFDRLGPDARRFLRIASVLGVDLDVDDLLGVLALEAPDLVPPWEEVAEFFAQRPDGTASFSNIVFHDVAYEGLPFKLRRRLHKRVGTYIENNTDDPDVAASLLTVHFAEARDHPRTWRYGRVAGDAAAGESANVEAVANYTRALASARWIRDLEDDNIVDVARRLGEAHLVLGRFDEAKDAWQQARRRTPHTSVKADMMCNFGRVDEKVGRFTSALRWYDKALELLDADAEEARPSAELVTARSKVLTYRAAILIRQAAYDEAIADTELAAQLAEGVGAVRARADALDKLYLASTRARTPQADEIAFQVLDAFDGLGDHAGRSRILNNMGITAYFAGDWDLAAAHYSASVDEGVQAGALVDGLIGGLNAGEILSDQGRWDDARSQLEEVMRNWEAVGFPIGLAAGRLFLGVVARRQGRWAEARAEIGQAITEIENLGLNEMLDDARTRLCEVDVYSAAPDAATIDSLLAELGQDHPLAGRLRRLCAVSWYLDGRTDDAIALLREELDGSSGFDRLLVLRAIEHVSSDVAERARCDAEADELATQLGVIRLAPLPHPMS